VLSCAFLFLATTALAQQQGQIPPTTTPPTFPEGRHTQREPLPPDTMAPPAETKSSDQVEAQILDQLKAEPTLAGSNIDAHVDDNAVVLTGNVVTMEQHALALHIAQSRAGERKVVDKIKVKQQT
jgi:osmotically-inducible protein OsmY